MGLATAGFWLAGSGSWAPTVPATLHDLFVSLGPIGYWRLDDASGATAAGIGTVAPLHYTSGVTLNQLPGLTDCGTSPAVQSSMSPSSPDPQGVGYILPADAAAMPSGSHARSIVVFLRTTHNGIIVSYGNNAANQAFYMELAGGHLYFDNRLNDNLSWGSGLDDGATHMLGLTYGTAATAMKGYVDGALVSSQTLLDGALNTVIGTFSVVVGASFENGLSGLDGLFADLAFFDYELAAADMAALWDMRCTGGWQVGSIAIG